MILSLAAHKNCQYYFKPSIKHLWRGADQSEDYCICNDKCPISCNSSLYQRKRGKFLSCSFIFPPLFALLKSMDRLPLEVFLNILSFLPISSYTELYTVFPMATIDEALRLKLKHTAAQPQLHLVSTNLHELLAPGRRTSKNESSLPLFFAAFDKDLRQVWFFPKFAVQHHYFKVKDAYVSHGKLILRSPDTARDLALLSLWDIRKRLPPTRAGTFSGASEIAQHETQIQDLTIEDTGCVLDACLLCPGDSEVCKQPIDAKATRPPLPQCYTRKAPSPGITDDYLWEPIYPDPTCGYFLVERVGLSISKFLELNCQVVK